MKIGLVRHFKVNQSFPEKKFLTKSEIIKWFDDYNNTTNIEYKNVDLGDTNWRHCYSSTMIRAANTANHIYNGTINEVNELRELEILHRLPNKLSLPFIVWGILARIISLFQNRDINDFENNIAIFLDKILANQDKAETLIVSHMFVMKVIRKQLLKRGFKGRNFKLNEYGILFIFEKK